MGQVLRMTHNGVDYSFVILNKEPLSRETREIIVSVNGETKTLVQRDRSWLPAEEAGDVEVAMAIGKTIALRYRI
ncbi:hypothetical protein [Mucilaginibacter paludis]|nr:hypothetical protein [Mucilaginibacter paludis]